MHSICLATIDRIHSAGKEFEIMHVSPSLLEIILKSPVYLLVEDVLIWHVSTSFLVVTSYTASEGQH